MHPHPSTPQPSSLTSLTSLSSLPLPASHAARKKRLVRGPHTTLEELEVTHGAELKVEYDKMAQQQTGPPVTSPSDPKPSTETLNPERNRDPSKWRTAR